MLVDAVQDETDHDLLVGCFALREPLQGAFSFMHERFSVDKRVCGWRSSTNREVDVLNVRVHQEMFVLVYCAVRG